MESEKSGVGVMNSSPKLARPVAPKVLSKELNLAKSRNSEKSIVTISAILDNLSMAALYNFGFSVSPYQARESGMAIFGLEPNDNLGDFGKALEYSSLSLSSLAKMSKATWTSCKFKPKIPIQSKDLQAGTRPWELKTPRDGLTPIKLFKEAGTRLEPAVSVPKDNGTIPLETTLAEPEEEPPETCLEEKAQDGFPYGDLTPTKPVAN
ncbi:hypothetical protein WICPIJ_004233 [Wickerhamomyces pijperi]|uniref:Uncharacterized protein n=1 Tax=Wickerhamomyces pijperi TaxID=599730 RepID=A0A9P8TN31_WICPI|nr:hypothetical protein WICPIJ_004233 [Wickerhamomyces pijperi]